MVNPQPRYQSVIIFKVGIVNSCPTFAFAQDVGLQALSTRSVELFSKLVLRQN